MHSVVHYLASASSPNLSARSILLTLHPPSCQISSTCFHNSPPPGLFSTAEALGQYPVGCAPCLSRLRPNSSRAGTNGQSIGLPSKFIYLHLFVLLMLCSAYGRLHELSDDFCVAALQGDVPRLKHLAGQIALLVGKIVVVDLTRSLSERAQGVVA